MPISLMTATFSDSVCVTMQLEAELNFESLVYVGISPQVVSPDLDGAPLDGAPLDGAPLDDLDGSPLAWDPASLDGVPVDDIDGVPLGAPMDDIDGMPCKSTWPIYL